MYCANRDYGPHRKGDHNGAVKLCSERSRLYCAWIWLWRHDDMINWRPSIRVLISITSGTLLKVMMAHLATIHEWGKLCHCCQSGDGVESRGAINLPSHTEIDQAATAIWLHRSGLVSKHQIVLEWIQYITIAELSAFHLHFEADCLLWSRRVHRSFALVMFNFIMTGN